MFKLISIFFWLKMYFFVYLKMNVAYARHAYTSNHGWCSKEKTQVVVFSKYSIRALEFSLFNTHGISATLLLDLHLHRYALQIFSSQNPPFDVIGWTEGLECLNTLQKHCCACRAQHGTCLCVHAVGSCVNTRGSAFQREQLSSRIVTAESFATVFFFTEESC